MGDRINVVVTTDHASGIALYSHWGGYRMPKTIAKFLSNTGRLDPDYFTRNLLCSMIADGVTSDDYTKSGYELIGTEPNVEAMLLGAFQDELSYGISLNLAGDREHPVIVLNPEVQSAWLMKDYDVLTITECAQRALGTQEISFKDFTKVTNWIELENLTNSIGVAI
jgi:hypothetical protein